VFVSHAARINSVKLLDNDLKTMIETLERALAPLLIIGSFCNLGMFEYPRGQLGRISRAYMFWSNGALLRSITMDCITPII